MVDRPRSASTTARGVFAATLVESRKVLLRGDSPTKGGQLELIDELLTQLHDDDDQALGAWLVAFGGPDGERRATLADVVGRAAHRLAPDDEPPSAGAAVEVWQALVLAVDSLYGSGAHALGRLPFINGRVLDLLVAEARHELPERPEQGQRIVSQPGSVLANVAVSRKLREAIARAVGFPVVPTYNATYLYDPPGSHVRTHVDTRDYELVFHLILEHTLPGDGSGGSALVVHRPGEPEPTRLTLEPGESVALQGRGTVHSWEALRGDENRTLIAIGFERGADD